MTFRMKPDQKLRGFSLVDEEIPRPRSKEDRLLCLERGTGYHGRQMKIGLLHGHLGVK